jgi:hypothetical protein
MSSDNCESKVFAERENNERLSEAFFSTDLAGYFNDPRAVLGLYGVSPPIVQCADL